MSRLMTLRPVDGSTCDRKRRGRGNASGLGRQAGRGHKGWHSRSGSKRVAWYEGGQMPLQRRVPKRGFSNYRFREHFQIVNISDLVRIAKDQITPAVLLETGVIKNTVMPVKVLGDGEIEKAVDVTAHRFSQTAKEKIEKAGGKVTQQ